MARAKTVVREPVHGGKGVAETRERSAVRAEIERNAPRAQVFHTWGCINLGNTAVRRFMRSAASDAAVSATENQSVVPVAVGGLLTRLRVKMAAPLTGVDTTFTVRVNEDDTPLRVTVVAGQSDGVVNSTVAVREGDSVTLATDTSVADGATSSFSRATVLWRVAA
jgi:hypothetical protein